MRGGQDEATAYAGARNWMMSEGPRLFSKLDLPTDVRSAAVATPADVVAARSARDTRLAEQLAEIREALSQEKSAAAPHSSSRLGAGAAWKTFGGHGADARAAALSSAASRSLSREPVLPRRPLEQDLTKSNST
jgi:hypothetical protein